MYKQGFAFEQWVVTPGDSTVAGPYGETRLEPRVMDVLVHLAAHSAEVVSRNDLIDTVWGGAVVGEEVLSRCIYQIRRALGESSREPRFIQTVPKRGYRLNAPVVDLADAAGSIDAESWAQGSPFRGLDTFDAEHAPVFFGRTRATFEALTALRQQVAMGKSFLLLLGASGVGKSSLARAGILSNLLQSHDAKRWYHDVFTPGLAREGPIVALRNSLSRALALSTDQDDELLQIVTQDVEGIARFLGEEERIVLVTDQLEEVFSGTHIEEHQRHEFFDAIERLTASGYCWVVSTLRSDFYPHCSAYPALMRLKKAGGQYDVRPMGPAEIQRAIRLPATAAGLKFDRDRSTSVTLDEAIYEAAVGHPKMLPLLEFTLQALYDTRSSDNMLTFNAYDRIGGLEGSLACRAESVFKSLPTEQQALLPYVMSRMVSLRDNQAISASCPLEDFPTQPARELIQSFVDARLFSTELGASGAPQVAVTHETLLSQWPRIQEWVEENRDLIRVRQRVVAACARWENESQRDDLLLPRGKALEEAKALAQSPGIELKARENDYVDASHRRANRRRRFERAGIAGLAALTLAAGVLAWQAIAQRNAAVEQRAIAKRETLAANETADFLLDIFSSADPSEASGGQLTAKRVLDEANARLDSGLVAQAGLRTRLRALIARAYRGIGLYTDAEALLRQADREAQSIGTLTEREQLEIRYQLADTLFRRGDLEAAETLHAEILSRRQELFGEADLDTAFSQAARAHELWRDGEIGDAEALFRQVLSTRQEVLGERHKLVTDVLSTLGSLYYSQGILDEAERFHRAAVEQGEETYGQRSIRLAIALSNLAHVESDPAESEALFNRSLAIRREVVGPDHILVARAEEKLAMFYAQQGEPEQAEPLYRQAIRKVAMSDEGSSALGWSQNTFARFLESQKRSDEAIDLYRDARDNFASQLGDGHRWTLVVHGNLASANYAAGKISAALQVFEEAIAAARSAEAPSELAIADLQRAYTDVLLHNGDVVEARRAIRASVDYYGRDAELHRSSLSSALGRQAEALFLSGQLPDALASARKALELSIEGSNESASYTEYLIGIILAESGDCVSALSMFDDGLTSVAAEARTGPQWERLETQIEAARDRCAK